MYLFKNYYVLMPFYLYIILKYVHIGHWCIIAIYIGKKLSNHSYNCSVSTVGSIAKLLFFFQFKTRESNLTGFVKSLSKLIVHFSEYACKSFLVKLLIDKESILVKHLNWLVDIMQSLDQQHWCILLK